MNTNVLSMKRQLAAAGIPKVGDLRRGYFSNGKGGGTWTFPAVVSGFRDLLLRIGSPGGVYDVWCTAPDPNTLAWVGVLARVFPVADGTGGIANADPYAEPPPVLIRMSLEVICESFGWQLRRAAPSEFQPEPSEMIGLLWTAQAHQDEVASQLTLLTLLNPAVVATVTPGRQMGLTWAADSFEKCIQNKRLLSDYPNEPKFFKDVDSVLTHPAVPGLLAQGKVPLLVRDVIGAIRPYDLCRYPNLINEFQALSIKTEGAQ